MENSISAERNLMEIDNRWWCWLRRGESATSAKPEYTRRVSVEVESLITLQDLLFQIEILFAGSS